jgi:sporulation protein YlmC with PRC-barrel domain
MKYLAATALALCMAAPALAQQAPAANQPAPATAPGGDNKFMTNEAPNQWLVGNLWNKNVYDASGKSIGDLKDVVVGPDGKIQALVIGVGGFLGLGEKNVAVDYGFVQKNGSISPNRITLNMSEQDLRAAPNFNRTGNNTK